MKIYKDNLFGRRFVMGLYVLFALMLLRADAAVHAGVKRSAKKTNFPTAKTSLTLPNEIKNLQSLLYQSTLR